MRGKIFLFAALGNGLESYDYALYGAMLSFLSLHFFPQSHPQLSLSLAFFSFAMSFLVTPLGSLFWGWYGDRFGRVHLLRLSLALMALPSMAIALLPSYAQIGLAAPFLLMILRIIQGLSASGEIMGSKIFALEQLGPESQGMASGVVSAAGAAGVLLALSMAAICYHYAHIDFLWRIPFILGGALAFLSWRIRRTLYKTWTQENAQINSQKTKGILKIFPEYQRESWTVFALGAFLGLISYLLSVFMVPFLRSQGLAAQSVYQASLIGLCFTVISCLLTGRFIDQKQKDSVLRCLYVNLGIYAVLAFPLFIGMQAGGWALQWGYIILASLLGSYATASGIMMYRAFAADIRCRGVLFNYALGTAIWGGGSPWIMYQLAEVHRFLPGVFLSVCAITVLCLCLGPLRLGKVED